MHCYTSTSTDYSNLDTAADDRNVSTRTLNASIDDSNLDVDRRQTYMNEKWTCYSNCASTDAEINETAATIIDNKGIAVNGSATSNSFTRFDTSEDSKPGREIDNEVGGSLKDDVVHVGPPPSVVEHN